MTTPSGQISAQDIKNEFGETGSGSVSLGDYRVQETRGALTLNIGDGVPGPGQTISYQSMRGRRLNIVVDYYADNPNLNRAANGDATMNAKTRYNTQNDRVHVIGGLKSYDKEDSSETKVIVHVNRKLGGEKSGNAAVCALRTGSGWESDTEMIIDVGNEGRIYGAGGNGGRGGDMDDPGDDGQKGTSGLGISLANVEVNVNGEGIIKAGFGGGGGGGNGRQEDKNADRRAGGGGGGGGQGFPAGSGGAAGNGNNNANVVVFSSRPAELSWLQLHLFPRAVLGAQNGGEY